MNIPQDTLQAVADAAFAKPIQPRLTTRPYHLHDWELESDARRAVIQYALDNPALAPFLAGGIGEYTDEELEDSWTDAMLSGGTLSARLRSFLAALPRRESPDLAQAIARAEKAEAERDFERSTADEAIARSDRTYAQICRAARSVGWVNMVESGPITTFIRKIGDELAALKSAQLAILRLPAAEARQERPVGFNSALETLGAAEATQPSVARKVIGQHGPKGSPNLCGPSMPAEAKPEPVEEPAWIDPVCGCWRSPDVPKDSPCPICKPAAQVPLGPEDMPPGSIVTNSANAWYKVKYVTSGGIRIDIQGSNLIDYEELKTDGWSINTSLATGRWDKDAWRPCSKPGK